MFGSFRLPSVLPKIIIDSCMKRLISLAVSTLILIIIYTQIDVAGLIAVFRDCNLGWMAISLGMVVPITFFFELAIAAGSAAPGYVGSMGGAQAHFGR